MCKGLFAVVIIQCAFIECAVVVCSSVGSGHMCRYVGVGKYTCIISVH